MSGLRRAASLTALTALAGLASAGCSGDGDGSGTGAGGWAGDDYSVAKALAEVPAAARADEDHRTIVRTGDLAAATELAGLERPDRLDDKAAIAWLLPLTGGRIDGDDPAVVHVPMPETLHSSGLSVIEDFDAELGWSLLDVDVFVEQSTPPATFLMASGELGQDSLADDLTEVSDDIVSAGDGDDLELDPGQGTVARPLGLPLRMAVDGDRLVASPQTSFVEDWLAGPEESLADDEKLLGVAEALDEAEVVSAILITLGAEETSSPDTDTDSEAPGVPFDAFGIGWGVEDDEALVSVAYHFESDDAADAAAGDLEELFRDGTSTTKQPLSDLVSVEDVTVDGPVATVALTMAGDHPPAILEQMLLRQDTPFRRG